MTLDRNKIGRFIKVEWWAKSESSNQQVAYSSLVSVVSVAF
jgi:hypothetical protein